MSLLSEQSEMIVYLEQQLAASQARENVLRNALVNAQAYAPCPMYITALNQPTDDSTLKAALSAEREREREAAACRDMFMKGSVSWILLDEHLNAIRALGE